MDILMLAHRIPYPPNKGDKIRSFHLLRALAERFRVHLATFIDDPHDERFVPELSRWCASHCVRPLSPRASRIRALRGFLSGEPLSVAAYRDAEIGRWIDATIQRERIQAVVVFSSAMAQYVADPRRAARSVVDFVDIDSDKWRQYSQTARWPMSFVYSREARLLQDFEATVARRSRLSVVVSPAERELLAGFDGVDGSRCVAARNGVDSDYWDAQMPQPTPFPSDERPIVFTGAMDYWANVDAVCWYATEVHPIVLQSQPSARFYVVGSNPTPAVRALAARGAVVTGRVEDVRPFLAHAQAVVAPLRLARGVQNKVLEAMAMGRRVVATSAAVRGITAAPPGVHVADDPAGFAAATLLALEDDGGARGTAARAYVRSEFDWQRNLAPLLAAVQESAEPQTRGG